MIDYFLKNNLTIIDELFIAALSPILSMLLIFCFTKVYQIKVKNLFYTKDELTIMRYKDHPRFGEFKGYIKEKGTGKIFPFIDVMYADNEPYFYRIIKDGNITAIDSDKIELFETYSWNQ